MLIGTPVLPVPSHPRIRHLGFVSDEEKYDALQAAEFLIMPSYFESLSMVALEAWGMGKPVLANGRCDVLRGQAMRSNAGLYYESYAEFVEAVRVLEVVAGHRRHARAQRPALLPGALHLADRREEVPRHVRAAVARAGGRSGRPGDGAASGLVAATAAVAGAGARGARRTAERARCGLERRRRRAAGVDERPAGRTARPARAA